MVEIKYSEPRSSYNCAKLAYEVGFNMIGSGGFHYVNEKLEYLDDYRLEEIYSDLAHNKDVEFFKAPTHALIQKWLLKEFGIYVNADIHPINGNYEWFIHVFNPTFYEITKGQIVKLYDESEGHIYAEFDDAMDDGLIEALKILKNEKYD